MSLECGACGRQAGAVVRNKGQLRLRYQVRHRLTAAELDASTRPGDRPQRHRAGYSDHVIAEPRDPWAWPWRADEPTEWTCPRCGRTVVLIGPRLAEALDRHDRGGGHQTVRLAHPRPDA